MKNTNVIIALVLGVFLGLGIPAIAGCAALSPQSLTVPGAYVEADRATFDAVAPVIVGLTDGDPTNDPDLTGVNALALKQTIDTWQVRLIKAENSLVPAGVAP